ncbi:MAG: hypothetical protein IKQ58_08610 [Prevotella sp.]|nr:hypothetical protein [Prevotella sp.]
MAAVIISVLLSGCTDSHQQRLQLEELERQNRADSVMQDLTLAQSLADHFDRHGTRNEQLRAHYILGRTHADRGELPQAVAAYNDAADRADTIATDCDYRTLSRVHAQTAQLYYSQLLPDNMIREERRAMKFAEMAKDTMQYLYCYGMLAEGYDMKDMKDSALQTLSEAYSLYNKIGAEQMASALCCSMANICIQQKDYTHAEKYMREYETRSGFFDEHGNIEHGKEMYYSCKGHLCLDTSDRDNAEYYFRKLLGVANNYSLKSSALVGLRQFYSIYFNKDSLIKYTQLCDSLGKIGHIQLEMQKTLQVQAMYDYTRSEQIAHQKEQEAERFKTTLLVVCALSAILILLLAIAYIRHKNAQALLQSKYQSEMEKLALAQADLLALRSEQSVSQTLLSQKELEIKTLQEATEQYRHKIHTLQGYALNDRLQQAPVTLRLQQCLKQNPYLLPTFDDWRELKMLINHEIPSFYDTLNAEGNNLNDFEYDVCVLIRLQFSLANIAKLKKCSAPYITQIRKGIYEKIFKKEGLAEELDKYILSLT